MSTSNQVNEHPTRYAAGFAEGSASKKTFLVIGCGLILGTGLSFWASRPAAESYPQPPPLRTDQPPARGAAATGTNKGTSVAQQPAAASRYRVVAETAYFFDGPHQSAPTGKYLRRGDVLYGEGEANGFVKTRFVSPSGTTVVGWLKGLSLTKLDETPVAALGSRPHSHSSPAQAPLPTSPGRVERAGTNEPAAKKAVVQTRSYFYPSPDLAQPRKAYCEPGDKVQLGESRGAAVFVTFTNWEKVTTTGWMRKDALRGVR